METPPTNPQTSVQPEFPTPVPPSEVSTDTQIDKWIPWSASRTLEMKRLSEKPVTLRDWQQRIVDEEMLTEKNLQQSQSYVEQVRLQGRLSKLAIQQSQLWMIEDNVNREYSQQNFAHMEPETSLSDADAKKREEVVLGTSSDELLKRLDVMVQSGEKMYKEEYGGVNIQGLPDRMREEAEDLARSIDCADDLRDKVLHSL